MPSGSGRPLTKTPPSWLTPLWPSDDWIDVFWRLEADSDVIMPMLVLPECELSRLVLLMLLLLLLLLWQPLPPDVEVAMAEEDDDDDDEADEEDDGSEYD